MIGSILYLSHNEYGWCCIIKEIHPFKVFRDCLNEKNITPTFLVFWPEALVKFPLFFFSLFKQNSFPSSFPWNKSTWANSMKLNGLLLLKLKIEHRFISLVLVWKKLKQIPTIASVSSRLEYLTDTPDLGPWLRSTLVGFLINVKKNLFACAHSVWVSTLDAD